MDLSQQPVKSVLVCRHMLKQVRGAAHWSKIFWTLRVHFQVYSFDLPDCLCEIDGILVPWVCRHCEDL